jgi:hypothetical protein
LSSAYAHLLWQSARGALGAGARVDRWSLTHDAAASPWVQSELALRGTLKLRAGAGVHRQFPGFEETIGPNGGELFRDMTLRHERAYHVDAGLEQRLGASARWQLTVYSRRERDLLRLPAEPRLRGGEVADVFPSELWANRLDGRLRGESFDGDYDQPHTFNAYGSYRLSSRMALGGKLRIGSNTPAVGYWQERNSGYFLGSTRNSLRVPPYARLDLRASRTFDWNARRLTLFVEVLNALGRQNVRYERPLIDFTSLQAFGMFRPMIPRVPSAGLLVEF